MTATSPLIALDGLKSEGNGNAKFFAPPHKWLDGTKDHPELEEIGLMLLKENKVAILMVAGGLSTRIGGEGLRGDIPIGPVTNRSIFRLQGEKIVALRERYSPRMLWLIMTSEAVHQATLSSFENENYYGFPRESIFLFQQPSFPVVDKDGKTVGGPNGKSLESPGGNGGVLEALRRSNLLTHLQREGVEYIFYFQYPNVLENICDPIMLGYHHAEDVDVTVKAIMEYSSDEPMGRCAEFDGKLLVVEYHLLRSNASRPAWDTVPACMGTYVFSISFLLNCIKNNVVLPYYPLPYNKLDRDAPSLKKVEQFVCDLLPYSTKSCLIVVDREKERAPVKTKTGTYSVESGKRALASLYYNWLIKAGAIPQDNNDVDVLEISPRFALNYKELQSKISPGFPIYNNMVLQ
jgi:UDP-N-acetylglucosamine/UDP-N-acetylgalactosamine diphosphorylase